MNTCVQCGIRCENWNDSTGYRICSVCGDRKCGLNDEWKTLFKPLPSSPCDVFMSRQVVIRDKLQLHLINDLGIPRALVQLILSYATRTMWNAEQGDLIQVSNSFYEYEYDNAVVMETKDDGIAVHYLGWSHIWDEWLCIKDIKIRCKALNPIELLKVMNEKIRTLLQLDS